MPVLSLDERPLWCDGCAAPPAPARPGHSFADGTGAQWPCVSDLRPAVRHRLRMTTTARATRATPNLKNPLSHRVSSTETRLPRPTQRSPQYRATATVGEDTARSQAARESPNSARALAKVPASGSPGRMTYGIPFSNRG